jgi:discoidin domain receptor family protein 2
LQRSIAADGIVSYDMRQGDRRGTDLDLYDYTYDGSFVAGSNRLVGGLGQLTDGEVGPSNFRLHPSGTSRRGYEWVGWKLDSFSSGSVDIDFRFDAIRNFSSVTLHVGNAISKEVRVFRSLTAVVEIDNKGSIYNDGDNEGDEAAMSSLRTSAVEWRRLSEPIVFENERDDVFEYPRHVTVPLQHAIGRRVVLNMFFDARWIMVSEVQFTSGKRKCHQNSSYFHRSLICLETSRLKSSYS